MSRSLEQIVALHLIHDSENTREVKRLGSRGHRGEMPDVSGAWG
jgi:hypothetical protein